MSDLTTAVYLKMLMASLSDLAARRARYIEDSRTLFVEGDDNVQIEIAQKILHTYTIAGADKAMEGTGRYGTEMFIPGRMEIELQFVDSDIPELSVRIFGASTRVPNAMSYVYFTNYGIGAPVESAPLWALSLVEKAITVMDV